MPKIWVTPQSISPPITLQTSIGGHPLVAQTLVRRGLDDVTAARGFLDPTIYMPSSPAEMPNLSRAADRIEGALQKNEAILVWGDFDVDGQTATTLLVESLRVLGADINYHIPVRATESHGIRIKVLEKHLSQYPQTRLIITCDTGIAEHEAVEYAQSHGVDVIITDHHELTKTLPKVFSVVNPHLLPDGHPLCSLPGVGVAYKLVEELFMRSGKTSDTFLVIKSLESKGSIYGWGVNANTIEPYNSLLDDNNRLFLPSNETILRDSTTKIIFVMQ